MRPGSAPSDTSAPHVSDLFGSGSTPEPEDATPVQAGRPLRTWQKEALDAYEQQQRGAEVGSSDFLVTATPGAGKTTFALTLAAGLLERRSIDRLIVVCPTDHLRTQWAEAAAHVGLALDPNLPNSVGPVRADVHGYVTT